MQKNPLIIASIGLVCVMVLASLTNVVGYQSVHSSKQIINNDTNQKEFLFQTLVDMSNNKEIKKVILGFEMTEKSFYESGVKYSVINFPVITEKFFKQAYTIGLILTKIINKSKIHSLLERYKITNHEIQKEISMVIEKDAILSREKMQLLSSKCDCEKNNTLSWNFPVICTILFPIELFIWALVFWAWILFHIDLHNLDALLGVIDNIGLSLNCFWA